MFSLNEQQFQSNNKMVPTVSLRVSLMGFVSLTTFFVVLFPHRIVGKKSARSLLQNVARRVPLSGTARSSGRMHSGTNASTFARPLQPQRLSISTPILFAQQGGRMTSAGQFCSPGIVSSRNFGTKIAGGKKKKSGPGWFFVFGTLITGCYVGNDELKKEQFRERVKEARERKKREAMKREDPLHGVLLDIEDECLTDENLKSWKIWSKASKAKSFQLMDEKDKELANKVKQFFATFVLAQKTEKRPSLQFDLSLENEHDRQVFSDFLTLAKKVVEEHSEVNYSEFQYVLIGHIIAAISGHSGPIVDPSLVVPKVKILPKLNRLKMVLEKKAKLEEGKPGHYKASLNMVENLLKENQQRGRA